MMNETMIKKMEELLSNEEFSRKFQDAGSYENAHKLFVENGVDVSYEEFAAYLEDCRKLMVEKGLISEDGELSEELLGAVSGGKGSIGGFLWGAGCVIGGLAVGLTPVGIGMVIGGVLFWGLDAAGIV